MTRSVGPGIGPARYSTGGGVARTEKGSRPPARAGYDAAGPAHSSAIFAPAKSFSVIAPSLCVE